MIGTVLALLGLGGLAAALRKPQGSGQPGGPGGYGGSGSGGGKGAKPGPDETVVQYIGGGTPDDELPMIVLLHAEGSNATDALNVLAPLPGPVRVVMPLGRFGTSKARHHVDPGLTGAALTAAMADEALRLAAFIQKTAPSYNTGPARVIVVGLGTSGALAVAVGLGLPLQVRRAWATGGAFPAAWVPAALPPLNGNPVPIVRKLTWGAALPIDQAAVELATSRGFDFSAMTFLQPPTLENIQKWMLGDLQDALLVP